MFSTNDTIVAIATPAGRGALGVVRLSGPDSRRIVSSFISRSRPLEPRLATFTTLIAGEVRDQVVVTWFPAPRSYTGEDVVEVSAHGSSLILRAIVSAACDGGARLAAPGEFTLRAFLNGRLDLSQAEAVADLIEAATPLQARVAFDQLNGTVTGAVREIEAALFDVMARLEASVDFPDEGYHFIEPGNAAVLLEAIVERVDALLSGSVRGRVVRDGARVAIVGRPNVGKSSLFNALVGSARAIVSDQAGTTRDVLSETVNIGGLAVTLVDTAGLSDSGEAVEREGVRRARLAGATADLVLHVVNGAVAGSVDDIGQITDRDVLLVASKADLQESWVHPEAVRVSSLTGDGLAELGFAIERSLCGEGLTDTPAVSNLRHVRLLEQVRAALVSALAAIQSSAGSLPEEFLLADLQSARGCLEEVTGQRASDAVLIHVFEHFCVGK